MQNVGLGRALPRGRLRAGWEHGRTLRFRPTPVEGAQIIDLDRRGDDRGFFARLFCGQEFADAGLEPCFVQANNTLTARRATLRGLHFQLPPAAEAKVVRCIRGALFDVVADLRPDSPSYAKWFGAELSAENRSMMYVPRGCAHGFITLADDTEVLYLHSAPYAPELERGLRFDDPWLGIAWPVEPAELSAKDRAWPYFDPTYHGVEAMRGLLRCRPLAAVAGV
jgi:dTDP-4-dehydrorhamnose 3,5-epimerase